MHSGWCRVQDVSDLLVKPTSICLGKCYGPLNRCMLITVMMQVSALSKDSGPAVLRARLPQALSSPLLGCPPQVRPRHQLGCLWPALPCLAA